MSNVFKLDDIVAAADVAFANYPVDLGDGKPPVVLKNVLQMSEDERKKISAQAEMPEDDDETTLSKLRAQIRLVAEGAEGAERLIEALGDNLAHLIYLIRDYNKQTQVGEA